MGPKREKNKAWRKLRVWFTKASPAVREERVKPTR